MNRQRCLTEALRVTTKTRERQHGNPRDVYRDVGRLWSTFLNARYGVDLDLDANDCAIMLSLMKIGRSARQRKRPDNYVDQAGYAAIAAETR